jgi:hypothetical protein
MGGGCCRRLQGKNIKNEIAFEVHTGGGGRGLYRRWCPSTGEERRGMYRRRYTGGGMEPNRRW